MIGVEDFIKFANTVVGGIAFIMAMYVRNSMLNMQDTIMKNVHLSYLSRQEMTLLQENFNAKYQFMSTNLSILREGLDRIDQKLDALDRRRFEHGRVE